MSTATVSAVAASPKPHRLSRPSLRLIVAAMTASVLILNAGSQIYDSNYYLLSEATSLLAGDNPYRDFFEWGAPLGAYISAGGQLISGHRLIGETATQWLFIVAGAVLAFELAMRVSRSVAASLVATAFSLLVLSATATYHYTKLLVFPAAVWLAWRYIDRPNRARAVALGVLSVVAFGLRHDYGLYVGCASFMALALAHVPTIPWRRRVVRDGAAYTFAAALLVAPWAAVVQANEGLIDYVRTRTSMFEQPGSWFAYSLLLSMNPVRELRPDPPPAPRSGVVGFFWNERADEAKQRELTRQCALRPLGSQDSHGRPQYEAANIYDTCLLALDPFIVDGAGFDWDRLRAPASYLPSRANATLWLAQMMLLVPVFILGGVAARVWRAHRRSVPVDAEVRPLIVAAVFLMVVECALFREPAYMVTVAPIAGALAARFLAARRTVIRACAIAALVTSVFAASVRAKDAPMFHVQQLPNSLSSAFHVLIASPPTHENPLFAYLRECTAAGDRVLVTGPTPFHVNYLVGRPMAGGHLNWPYGWRSDAVHEQQSLALLQQQSVPFMVATQEPALQDFAQYPHIRAYLAQHYQPLRGTQPSILVDTRRSPTGRWEWQGRQLPCFRQ